MKQQLYHLIGVMAVVLGLAEAAKMDDRFVLKHPPTNSKFKNPHLTQIEFRHLQALERQRSFCVPPKQNNLGPWYIKSVRPHLCQRSKFQFQTHLIKILQTFNLAEFEIQVDLSMHNTLKSTFGDGSFRLYLLRDNPMKSAFEYGMGLNDMFDGAMIHISENAIRNSNKKEIDDPVRLHSIMGYLRDEEYQLINKPDEQKCAMQFDEQTLYLHVKDRKFSLGFKDKLTKKENLKHCFEFELPEDYFTEDHDLYFFLSAFSGVSIPQEHVIHNIRFWDTNHVHDSEGQDTTDDKRDFNAKPHDVMRERVMKSEQQYTTEAYNQQVIKHNKLYSKLVSEFIANSEMILKLLDSMPNHDVIRNIQQEANQISSRFSLMEEQFVNYQN